MKNVLRHRRFVFSPFRTDYTRQRFNRKNGPAMVTMPKKMQKNQDNETLITLPFNIFSSLSLGTRLSSEKYLF